MTADRAALVEKVARVIETRQINHFTIQASAAIDLIRDEVLEEAAVVFSRYEDDPFTAAVVADHLRRMKGTT
jgi:hypothetical protein